jgi:hypothetical protein
MIYDFAIPTRIAKITTGEEVVELINKWNGIVPCYLSVNPYTVKSVDEFGNEIRRAYITKAFFDFDNDLESVQKFVSYLLTRDLKFELNHSGNGHHIYIHLKGDGDGQNLRILQLSVLNEAKATCDMHVVGDTQRVSRLVNTWNLKSGTYCIPIRVEELGHEDGSKQRLGEKYIYGTQLLDLSTFTEDKFEYIKAEVISNMHINTDIPMIPCIKHIIRKINPNQIERYCLVMYLSNAIRCGRDLRGFDIYTISEEIMKFFEVNCSQWLDWDRGITKYQIENILPKTNIICGCRFLQRKGVCIGCVHEGKL